MYFESYINGIIKKKNLINPKNKKILRIESNFYHLRKRLRYRLLSSVIHVGFTIKSNFIDVDELKKILGNIGDVVWSNEKFSKMHDKLPLELFKVENIITLIEAKKYEASAFWFPITCAIIALTHFNIGFEYRDYILKCSLYFLVEYYLCWKRSEGALPQRKNGDSKDVIFYTNEILIEFCNTLHSHIQLLNNIPEYCFSRNSTSPLEHKYGFVRCKSRDIHTLSKFI